MRKKRTFILQYEIGERDIFLYLASFRHEFGGVRNFAHILSAIYGSVQVHRCSVHKFRQLQTQALLI